MPVKQVPLQLFRIGVLIVDTDVDILLPSRENFLLLFAFEAWQFLHCLADNVQSLLDLLLCDD